MMTEQTQTPPAEEASSKHRMPATFDRFLLTMQGGKKYLPAAYRLVWFRDEHPDWGIETCLLEGGQADGYATVRASIVNPEGRIIATAMKTETKADFPAGWVEKAETGSIARALAMCGFGTQFSALVDADEERRPADSPQDPRGNGTQVQQFTGAGTVHAMREVAKALWDGEGACPACNAPAGKPHASSCARRQSAQAAGR